MATSNTVDNTHTLELENEAATLKKQHQTLANTISRMRNHIKNQEKKEYFGQDAIQ